MKHLYVVAILLLTLFSIPAQAQLIPASDGGFESTTITFPGNGWTAVQPGLARQWQVGTAAGFNSGSKAAYIGSTTTNNGIANTTVTHFYRDIAIPAGATNVLLNFYLKETTPDNTYDYFYVFTTTTTNTPVAGTTPGTGYTQRYVNTASTYSTFTAVPSINLTALAGTTVRLVFSFKSDGVTPHANPAVDDISLTYTSCVASSAPTGATANAVSPLTVCSGTSVTLKQTGGTLGSGASWKWYSASCGGTLEGTSAAADASLTVTPTATTTYYVRAEGGGCSSTTSCASVVVNVNASGTILLTSGSASQTLCSGNAMTNFQYTIGGNATGITSTNLPTGVTVANSGNVYTFSGTPSVTGTFNYTITTTGSTCNNSAGGTITVNPATVTPASQPTGLVLTPVNSYVINGSFAASSPAVSGYLVIRTATPAAPSAPVNGTTYTAGTAALGGTVVSSGATTTFAANGLTAATTYYFWIYAYNSSSCAVTPKYLSTSPLNGSATTLACGANTLYWGGTGSTLTGAVTGNNFNSPSNWSTSSTSYVASAYAPASCDHVIVNLKATVTILLTANTVVNNLTLTESTNSKIGVLNLNGYALTVNGNTIIDVLGGDVNTFMYVEDDYGAFSGTCVLEFKGNVSVGPNQSGTALGGAGIIEDFFGYIRAIFRGNLVFGKIGLLGASSYNPPTDVYFDAPVSQNITWNNTLYYASFRNVIIGLSNSPVVTQLNGVIKPDNLISSLYISNNSVLDLGTNQWNRNTNGSGLFMTGGSRLKLGGTSSVANGGTATLIPGSNFPSGFTTVSLASTSAVEYNAGNGTTQTIYSAPTYGSLEMSNVTGSGTALKNLGANITGIAANLTVNTNTTFDQSTFTANRSAAGGTMSLLGNAVLKLGGSTGGRTGSNFPNNFTATTIQPSATVEYNGTNGVNQVVYAPVTYGNLTLSNLGNAGSSVKSLTADVTGIAGNLTINPFAVYNLSGFLSNRSAAGGNFSLASNGGLILGGISGGQAGSNFPSLFTTITAAATSTVEYNGAAQTIFNGLTYGNLTLSGTGTKTAPSGTLSITGNLSKTTAATFVHNNGLVSFNGTAVQTYSSAAPAMSFNNLTNNNTAGLLINGDMDVNLELELGTSSKLNLGTGNISLKSTALQTANLDQIPASASISYSGTGRFIMERFINVGTQNSTMHGKGWAFLSTPVQSDPAVTIKANWQENNAVTPGNGVWITDPTGTAAGFDAPSPGPSVKSYLSIADTWASPNSTTIPLTEKRGYMLYVRGDRTIQNSTVTATSPTTLRIKGSVYDAANVPPATTVTADKFEAIGNPYASAIDWTTLTKTGGIEANRFYVWDPTLGSASLGGYQVIQYFVGTGNYIATPGGFSANSIYNASLSSDYRNIQSGQAFFVHTTGTAGTVSFSESNKVSGSRLAQREGDGGTNNLSSEMLRSFLFLNNRLADGNMVVFDNGFVNDVDADDAIKVSNSGENFGLTRKGKSLSIEARKKPAAGDTLYFRMSNMLAQGYRLGFVPSFQTTLQPVLVDNYLATRTDINFTDTTFYDFNVTGDPASKAADRFMIVFKPALGPLPVSITSVSANRNPDRSIAVNWTVENELNIERYTIERSADGAGFTGIITTAANNSRAYTKNDISPLADDNFYRIKATSIGGQVQYSAVVKVAPLQPTKSISVYPNPVVNKTMQVQFSNQEKGSYRLQLSNKLGQVVYSGTVILSSNNVIKAVRLDNSVSAGIYQLRIVNENGKAMTEQVIIE